MAKYFRLALETALELKTQEIITNETDMNTIKTKLIAGTMTLALARTAFRLYAGDSQAERYALHSTAYTSASPSAGGFPIGQLYLGADAGLALQQDVTIKDSGGSKISFDPGTRVDVAVAITSQTPGLQNFKPAFSITPLIKSPASHWIPKASAPIYTKSRSWPISAIRCRFGNGSRLTSGQALAVSSACFTAKAAARAPIIPI